MMRTLRIAALTAPIFALLSLAPAAQAAPVFTSFYSLTGGSCCGTGPFGTIELSQDTGITTTAVTVLVTMNSGVGIIDTGSHISFGFNITGDPAITISGLTTGFAVGGINVSQSGIGTFDYSVNCGGTGSPGCGPGSNNPFSSLTFIVSRANSAALGIGDFTSAFTADIANFNLNPTATGPVGSGTCTGDCGGGGGTLAVPEPVSFLLVGSGLIGAFFLRRRRA